MPPAETACTQPLSTSNLSFPPGEDTASSQASCKPSIPAVHVFCKGSGQTGTVRYYHHPCDQHPNGLIRANLVIRGRGDTTRVAAIFWGTPCISAEKSLETLLAKVLCLLEDHEPHRLRQMLKAYQATNNHVRQVSMVHQICGLFRGGLGMPELFFPIIQGMESIV